MADFLDYMASSFWCMSDQQKRDLAPVPSEDAYNFPECDYERNPTNLYKQIEARNWTAVNHFLLTGYWSGSFFADSVAPTEQACTWVTKYDPNVRRKKVMWTHLPIHAALSFGAPEGVIQLLVKMAPPTLRCADDQRMLPLHLAFRRGATDATIAAIMDVFPEAVAVRDFLGRTPAECSSEGPNPKRGTIIQTVLYYNQKAWEKKAAKAQEKHMSSVRETLKQRNEKIENVQTALDVVRCREDQSRESFKMLMLELYKVKGWYDNQKPNQIVESGESLSAAFVKELTERLDRFEHAAEALSAHQTQAKTNSDETLKDLKAVWDVNGWSQDLKLRSFKQALKEQEDSDASSNTSLNTGSTGKKDKDISLNPILAPVSAVAKPVLPKEETKNQIEAEPAAAPEPAMEAESVKAESVAKSKAESTKAESVAKSKAESKAASKAMSTTMSKLMSKLSKAESKKTEPAEEEVVEKNEEPVEEKVKETTEEKLAEVRTVELEQELSLEVTPKKVVPDVVSVEVSDSDSETELKETISEMTSLDMSEGASRSSSKKRAFRLGLSKLMKSSKKGSIDGSVKGSVKQDGSLPPKAPATGKQKKLSKLIVLKKGGGSVKVSPTL